MADKAIGKIESPASRPAVTPQPLPSHGEKAVVESLPSQGPGKTAEVEPKAADKSAEKGSEKATEAGQVDKSQLTDELSEELQEEEAAKKADKKEDEPEVDEAAEREKRLQELEKEIEAKKQELQEDLKSGDIASYQKHLGELQGLEKEYDGLKAAAEAAQAPAQPVQAPAQAAPAQAAPAQAAPMQAAPAAGSYPASAGSAPAASGTGQVGAPAQTAQTPINLKGDDKKMADFINNYLAKKGSPAAGQQAGELMVQEGKEHNVDPLVLLAIAGHETVFGTKGVGMRKMLGVGAYDSNPNGVTPYDGLRNQISAGAKTFANLRAKGGASAESSIGEQLAAANRGGWATDPNWHSGVARMYNQIVSDAQQYA